MIYIIEQLDHISNWCNIVIYACMTSLSFLPSPFFRVAPPTTTPSPSARARRTCLPLAGVGVGEGEAVVSQLPGNRELFPGRSTAVDPGTLTIEYQVPCYRASISSAQRDRGRFNHKLLSFQHVHVGYKLMNFVHFYSLIILPVQYFYS